MVEENWCPFRSSMMNDSIILTPKKEKKKRNWASIEMVKWWILMSLEEYVSLDRDLCVCLRVYWSTFYVKLYFVEFVFVSWHQCVHRCDQYWPPPPSPRLFSYYPLTIFQNGNSSKNMSKKKTIWVNEGWRRDPGRSRGPCNRHALLNMNMSRWRQKHVYSCILVFLFASCPVFSFFSFFGSPKRWLWILLCWFFLLCLFLHKMIYDPYK